ncbi:MAG: glycosyltransferase family 39 protein [candidate division WOR-3 bacterium]|nr:MAG: glycosyltransferase family 39 protein [candidate division WOR-3 bacterium]
MSSRLLSAALLATVALRLAFVLLPATTDLHTKTVLAVPDAPEYIRLAGNLASHRVFSRDVQAPFAPELFRTPGYSVLIAPLIKLPGPLEIKVIVLQVLLSVALAWAVYRLGLEIALSPSVASLAALLVAFSPNLAFLSTKIVTETAFTLLLAVSLLLYNRYKRHRSAHHLVGAGVCAGLLALVRPIAVGFPLVLAGHVLVRAFGPKPRPRVATALVPLAVAGMVVLPWVHRNGQQTGRYILSTASEHNLYLYSAATVLSSELNIPLPESRSLMLAEAQERFGPLDTTDEPGFWQAVSRVALRHVMRRPFRTGMVQIAGMVGCLISPISINPLLVHSGVSENMEPHVFQQALALAVKGRLISAFRLARDQRMSLAGPFASVVVALALAHTLLLVVFGVVAVAFRSGRRYLWLLPTIVYFTILPGPVGDARFRAPVEPLLALLAALGLSCVFGRKSGSNRPA